MYKKYKITCKNHFFSKISETRSPFTKELKKVEKKNSFQYNFLLEIIGNGYVLNDNKPLEVKPTLSLSIKQSVNTYFFA